MGKMKELFMKIHYPYEIDLEREYLINDSLAKEWEYDEYLRLQQDPEIHILNAKIEIANEPRTRIEVNQKEKEPDREAQIQ